MRDLVRLSIIVAKTSLIVICVDFALALAAVAVGFHSNARLAEGIFGVAVMLLPATVAIFWMWPALRRGFERREARSVSIAFAVLAPICLGLALVLAEITGGYGEKLGGRPLFGLVGAAIGTAVMMTLFSCVVCSAVFWITRLTIAVEKQ